MDRLVFFWEEREAEMEAGTQNLVDNFRRQILPFLVLSELERSGGSLLVTEIADRISTPKWQVSRRSVGECLTGNELERFVISEHGSRWRHRYNSPNLLDQLGIASVAGPELTSRQLEGI